MTQRPNIAQIEFFHTAIGAVSLDMFLGDMYERIVDGSRLKTAVRLLDEGNFITELALTIYQKQDCYSSLLEALFHSRGLRSRFLNFKFKRLAKKIQTLKEQALVVGVQQLDAAIHTSRQIAVELPDHRFRLAKPDEMHELLEAARRATGAWFFVFEPNDLLADKNTPVTHAM